MGSTSQLISIDAMAHLRKTPLTPPESSTVFDIGDDMILATLRRREFQSRMETIMGLENTVLTIKTKEDFTAQVILKIVALLKENKYRLHFDSLEAVLYLANVISRYIELNTEGSLVFPEGRDFTDDTTIQEGDRHLLNTLYSVPHDELGRIESLQRRMHESYLRLEEMWSKKAGQKANDYTALYAEMAYIAPLCIGTIKRLIYLITHAQKPEQGRLRQVIKPVS